MLAFFDHSLYILEDIGQGLQGISNALDISPGILNTHIVPLTSFTQL